MPYYLTKEYIKDAEGRPPSDPKYDPSTIFIPEQELNKESAMFK